MRLITITLLLCFTCIVKAQVITSVSQDFQNLPSPLPKAEVVDTTRLVVVYQHTYPVDNFQDGFKSVKDIICLQIGKEISKSFSQNLYLWDRNMTFDEKNVVKFRKDYIPYTVFANYPTGSITEENRIPNSRLLQGTMEVVTHTEPIPQMQWQLLEETDSIAGYNCQKAQCSFRGREWTVWYTPEIPATFSVWKFSGLPGLILKATDATNDYAFEVMEIRPERIPIEMHNWKPKKQTRTQWRKLERKMYEHPSDFFLQNGAITVTSKKNAQQMSAEEWTVRYNPIEKE